MKSAILAACLAFTASALPTTNKDLETRQIGSGSTRNDLVDGQCADVIYIFARGTGESGNVGTVVGPPLERALESAFGQGNVITQGVDYPATVGGTVVGQTNPQAAQGARKMAELVQTAAQQCPGSSVVLAGYSQGAQQVHGALINLRGNSNVKAAVTFGDPLSSRQFENIPASSTKVFCAAGDSVCRGQFIITPAHLGYGRDTPAAAQFVQGVIGA